MHILLLSLLQLTKPKVDLRLEEEGSTLYFFFFFFFLVHEYTG